jgi:hypothetical protein
MATAMLAGERQWAPEAIAFATSALTADCAASRRAGTPRAAVLFFLV